MSSPSVSRARAMRSSFGMRRRRSPSEPSQMFSRTDCWPAARISWKTVAMPAVSAARGEERNGTRWPPTVIVPPSGLCTPDRIFTSVLFPEPFSPMIAWTSPRRRSSEQSLRAWVAPKDFARPATSRTTSAGGETWLSVSGAVAAGSFAMSRIICRPPCPFLPRFRAGSRQYSGSRRPCALGGGGGLGEVRVEQLLDRHRVIGTVGQRVGRGRPLGLDPVREVAVVDRRRGEGHVGDLDPTTLEHPEAELHRVEADLLRRDGRAGALVALRPVVAPEGQRGGVARDVGDRWHRAADLLEGAEDPGRHARDLEDAVDLPGVTGEELERLALGQRRVELADQVADRLEPARLDDDLAALEDVGVDRQARDAGDAQDVALAAHPRGHALGSVVAELDRVGLQVDRVLRGRLPEDADDWDALLGGLVDDAVERRRGAQRGEEDVDVLLQQ